MAKPGKRPNRLLRAINRAFCRLWHRLPPGVHHLPERGVILAGNHRCGLDPLVLAAAVDRPVRFLMAREYYEGLWWLRWLFDLGGVIPVVAGGVNAAALEQAIIALENGEVIGIFPEGMANPPRPLSRLLPGAVFLAAHTGAPIVPFRISGVWPFDHQHIWPPIFRRSRAWVRFGAPIHIQADVHDRSALREASEQLRKAILALPRTRPETID